MTTTGGSFKFPNDEPVNFIDNNLVQLDPTFNSISAKYDPTLGIYLADPIRLANFNAEVTARQKSFDEAVQSYLGSKKANKLRLQVSVRSNWFEVLEEVRVAQEQYQSDGEKGMLRSMRTKFRSFSRNTQKVEQWLQMLPSESWQGSLVCGGIKIVLQTARRLGKMREDVCDAIDLIPELIGNTQMLEVLYPGGRALRAHASSLYIAILDVLELSLSWYDRNPFRKVTDSILKGVGYDMQFASALEELRSLEVRLDKQASLHVQFAQARIEQTGVEALTYMKSLLIEQKKTNVWQAEREQLQRELAGLRERERLRLITISEERKASLMHMLHYSRLSCLQDLETTSAVDTTAFDDAQDRIAYLLRRPELARWLGDTKSSCLIVNGGEPDHVASSATSLFTAMVARSLYQAKQSGAALIHWFCAQRFEDGARQMLRGLLGQLLDQSSEAIETPRTDRVGNLDDVRDLVRLFQYSIEAQLRHGPVYCIIDAVSFYEDPWRSRDLCYAFDCLTALAEESDQEHALKVLVTSPTRATDVCTASTAASVAILEAEDEVSGSLLDLDELDVLEHTRASIRFPLSR